MNKGDSLLNLRHTLAHLLAAAVVKLYPDTKTSIGPAIDDGFYYDFEFSKPITEEDLLKIEKEMQMILPTWDGFEAEVVTAEEAKVRFKNNPYKIELIEEIAKRKEPITIYHSPPRATSHPRPSAVADSGLGKRQATSFSDLCRGGHVSHPSKDVPPNSWKLDRIAGAYWRGDEKNKMLTRIYGLAFENKEALVAHGKQIQDAKERDHKKLGRELDLFVFSDLVGSGLPLWTPKGTTLRDTLDAFVWELRRKALYERVDIPHITKKELYVASGHWDKFKDELFRIKTREGHEFAMKPMNCPHHTQIYARKQWSYRELPQRYATTTKVYRDEQTGELAGLSRVRAITQDDAHVFARSIDVKDEVMKIYEIVTEFYAALQIPLKLRLSIWDETRPEMYLGTKEMWQKAVDDLEHVLYELGHKDFEWGVGEAAFYGPKVDFVGTDSLGRKLQVATIQLDMNMPERFDLFCINEKGEKERIVMIHAAIMGSIERLLAILIEHYGGAFPLWLAPEQVRVLAVSDKFADAARELESTLRSAGIRVTLDDTNETLGKKVRSAKLAKLPYWIVVGGKESDTKKYSLESGSGKIENLDFKGVSTRLRTEISNKTA